MRKTTLMLSVVVFGLLLAARAMPPQESGSESKTKAEDSPKAVSPYRLDFAVNEMEDGKKVNTRQYSMNLNAEDANEIKIGTRVPVEYKQGEFQYLDVGTRIWCRLSERSNGLYLAVRSDISNFSTAQQQSTQPIIRQMNINASTVVLPGRPALVGSVDDPNSKRQFQLEVTVTKLK